MTHKTFDEYGLIVEDEAVTTTASCTGINMVGLNVGTADYRAIIDTSATTGTVDGSNYYTLAVEVSDAVGGTYSQVGIVTAAATAGQFVIGFASEQIEGLITGADFFRVTVTKVGTTATAITYTAYLSRI
jgi:hypothetical protein